jgi:hypothetical protein
MKQLCCSLVVIALVGNSAITALSQSRETRTQRRINVSSNNSPNIQWELSEAETEEFIAMLARLNSRVAQTEHDHLGSRGLRVIVRDAALIKSEEIEVCNGIVRRGEAKSAHWFEDEGNKIERWLLETRRQRFEPGVYDGVKIQVESSREH